MLATTGQTFWLVGIFLVGLSSTLGAINVLVTIVQHRASGMTWMKLPFFLWSQFVTAILLLLAFPALQAAAIFQLMDRLAGTSFFLPSGMVVGGVPLVAVSGGGNPLLWQHLFWFLGHPEVYVLILPAMGIVAEVITTNARRPLWGYGLMVASVLFMGGMSMVVWAHHMFLSGMGTTLTSFFQVTTMIISVPSVVLVSSLVLTLWGGSIRFNTPMLFALAFLPMFGIGGLTGLPLGLAASDVALHDTYYIVAHFHYLVAPGTLFAIFAGIYHWYPRITGRVLNERLGQIHFWGSFVLMNAIFLPMFAMGLMGVNRRLYDAGMQYALAQPTLAWQPHMTYAAVALGFFQVPFIVNLIVTARRKVADPVNPWGATTLEWIVKGSDPEPRVLDDIPAYRVRLDTGTSATRLGVWLFLASEAMFFGALFSGYVMLRVGNTSWPAPMSAFPWLETGLLLGASVMVGKTRFGLIGANALALAFVAVKLANDVVLVGQGQTPAVNLMLACWFTLTSIHALHVLAGAIATGWLAGPGAVMAFDEPERWGSRVHAVRLYWLFVDLVWLIIVGAFYVF